LTVIKCLLLAAAVTLVAIGILMTAGIFGLVELGPSSLMVGILGSVASIIWLCDPGPKPEDMIKNSERNIKYQYLNELPKIVNFYRNNQEKISTEIAKQLSDTRQSLETIQGNTVPVKTPAGEKELEGRIKLLETAQKEFTTARDFYSRFNAIV